jgi:acetyltransferase-like isoleucine patch superfamily enzyme
MNGKQKYKREQLIRRLIFTLFGGKWFSFPFLFKLRIWTYRRYFNIGKNPIIEHNVLISRTHGLPGTIKIGNNVTIARETMLDYSGVLTIKNGVIIGPGVMIFTHERDMNAYDQGKDINIPSELIIGEHAYIGARSIILSTCNYIGQNAHIGAAAVVTKDVPANTTVVGIPAKTLNTRK